jgi:asparagine synthase (glutamine-hydrolysing)
MLTGQYGNGTVSWTGDQQRALHGFTHLRWIAMLRALRYAQRQYHGSFGRALFVELIMPLRANWMARQFRRGRAEAPHTREISPLLASRTRVVERMRESGYDPFHGAMLSARDQRLRYLLPGISPFGASWAETGASFALDVRDPTSDVRLIEYCLAIPDSVYRGADDERLLVRRAMEGLLPPEVQWNRVRGRQAADLLFRLRDDAANVEAVLQTVLASPLARLTLHPGALRDSWARIRATTSPATLKESFLFTRLLHLGLFLHSFD